MAAVSWGGNMPLSAKGKERKQSYLLQGLKVATAVWSERAGDGMGRYHCTPLLIHPFLHILQELAGLPVQFCVSLPAYVTAIGVPHENEVL